MRNRTGFEDLSLGMMLIIVALIIISLTSMTMWMVYANDIGSIKNIPKKVCYNTQEVHCFYSLKNVHNTTCMDFEFSNEEGKIYSEIRHELNCNNKECHESFVRDICEIK